MQKIEGYLEQMGLTPLETKVYLGLLEKGASTVLELSKHVKLNRTTTHLTIETLIKKGLATHIQNGSRRQIIPEPPEKLSVLIDQEKWEIKRKEDNLQDIITSIYDTVLNAKENTESQVKYYEGKRAVQNIYDDILRSSEIRAYVNSGEIIDVFPENFEKFQSVARNGRTEIWDLQEDNYLSRQFTEKVKIQNYHLKFFPKDIKIHSMDYLIYEDKITIIRGKPTPLAIVIQNRLLYENAKVLFDLMWRLLPN